MTISLVTGIWFGVLLIACGVAVWGSVALKSPVPALVALAIAGGGMWLFRATPQLWHRRVRKMAQYSQLSAFAIGNTPLTRTYLLIGPRGLTLIGNDDVLLAEIPRSDVEAIALSSRSSAVGMIVADGTEFLELPLALKVGGPAAQTWSIDGLLGVRRLLRALESDLRHADYPVTAID